MDNHTNINNNFDKCLVIESQYLGSIQYYAYLTAHSKALIEQYEYYEKGSYRNRAYIATPNGQLMLSVPLKRGKHQRKLMKDVEIAYDMDWQKRHWQSLASAYRSSPYFEFYEDVLEPIYQKKVKYLMDWNESLNALIFSQLELPTSYELTSEFNKKYNTNNFVDKRSAIHPKTKKHQLDTLFTPPTYHQVFSNKVPFLPNLSILDLLFAEGPNTLHILQKSLLVIHDS